MIHSKVNGELYFLHIICMHMHIHMFSVYVTQIVVELCLNCWHNN